MVRIYVNLAQKYNKTPAQVALKFLLSRGIAIIPKTKTIERLKENFDCWNFELVEDDIKKIKALHKNLRIAEFESFFPPEIDIFD